MDQDLHNSPESTAIRQRMEEVRCDLDEDVQEIVEGARDMGDWRSYVKSHPWAFLGAALAVGYLIVPGRTLGVQPAAAALAGFANRSGLLATLLPKGGARGMLLSLVGDLVTLGVSSYAQQQAGKLFAARAAVPYRDDQK